MSGGVLEIGDRVKLYGDDTVYEIYFIDKCIFTDETMYIFKKNGSLTRVSIEQIEEVL